MLQNLEKEFIQNLSSIYDESELKVLFKILLSHICGQKYVHFNNILLDDLQIQQFQDDVQQLKQKIPYQYVLGAAEFYGLTFKVNPSVLIPRPETEELVHLIIKEQKNTAIQILDIGTGSGCIPISLKKHLTKAHISAFDISEDALATAKNNAVLNQVAIDFFIADALNLNSDLFQQYDVIVSNPPYIAEKESATMDEMVKNHEPHLALFVSNDAPLIFYDKIGDFALNHLKKEGVLYFELNQQLAQETAHLLQEKGFKTDLIKDINHNFRILKAQLLG
ncbi:MAG: peptide chain release factor N(5)-glutamine methyltransferase [Sphingobacteriales bacterium]|nr:peptide chain release factor N(5)-glutamine methyltransferase [Sphingobacteriales bacterium]